MFRQNTQNTGFSFYKKLLLVGIFSYFLVVSVHLIIAKRFDLPLIFGERSEAIFDLWSVQHFLVGILLGSIFSRIKLLSSWREKLVVIILLEIFWEAVELSMESGLFGQTIAHWKGGFEHWSNRLIGDLYMVLFGALVAKRFPKCWKVIIVPSIIWLLLNVSFSSSMHVQHILFSQSDEEHK